MQISGEEDSNHIEERMRWADAFILVFSVTDRCSFDEVTRLKFLINHCRKNRTGSSNNLSSDNADVAIALEATKTTLNQTE